MLKAKFFKVSIFLIVFFSGLAWFFYDDSVDEKNIITQGVNNIKGGIEKIVKKDVVLEEGEVNFIFDVESSFELKNDGVIEDSGSFDLKGGEIVIKNSGLKQRFQIGDLAINYGDKVESISGLDMISDNEKVYYLLKGGIDAIIDSFDLEQGDEIKASFKKGEYIIVDNSKPLLKVLGDLANNETIKNLVIGLSSSNPAAYFEKNGTKEEIKKFIVSDKFLDYVFSESEYDEVSQKSNLTINEGLCDTYFPVIQNISKELGEDIYGMSSPEECKKSLKEVNNFLPMLMQLQKKGDIENGNFDFNITQGNIVDFNITYKNHIIDTWYINITDPNGMITLKVNGDKDKVLSSLFKVKVNEKIGNDSLLVSGTIKDGNGRILLNGNYSNGKINGNLLFKEYEIEKYFFKLEGDLGKESLNLFAKGNLNQGAINGSIISDERKVANINFSYTGATFDLDFYLENMIELNSYLKENEFNLYLVTKNYRGENEIEGSLNYKDGIIKGITKGQGLDLTIDGKVDDYSDFKLSLEERNSKSKLYINTEVKSLSELKYTANFDMMGENVLNGVLSMKESEEEGFNIVKTKLSIDSPKEKRTGDYNFTLKYKEAEAYYEIPELYNEIEVSALGSSPLPNMYSLSNLDKNIIITGTTGLGIAGVSTISVYTSQLEKARDSRRISDIKNIQAAIEQYYQDMSEYPSTENLEESLESYLWKGFPSDPSGDLEKYGCKFGYVYEVGDDKNGINNQTYRISTCFENKSNIERKAKTDGGIDDKRLEIGIDIGQESYKERFYIGGENNNTSSVGVNKIPKEGLEFISKLPYVISAIPSEMPSSKVTGLALVGGTATMGTIAYISLQGYSQDARNAKRISDINNIQTSLEMTYQDLGEYPSEEYYEDSLLKYISTMLVDPLEGQYENGCTFGYKYEVGDENGVKNQAYRLSACLEGRDSIVKGNLKSEYDF